MATKKEKTPVEEKITETGIKAEDQPWNKKTDARDQLDSAESGELTTIAVKSLANIEEKLEAVDWKLWEIYNIVKNYVESNPTAGVSAPQVAQPQASAVDIASEIAKALGSTQEPKEKKSVVGKLFGK
jgi:hypothetical protein